MARCWCAAVSFAGVCVLLASAGDVNYRDVVVNRQSDFMSAYFRRLYRPHCDEASLAERVRHADVILTGTIRALEPDTLHPGSDVARVEVKRVFKDYHQRQVTTPRALTIGADFNRAMVATA